MNDSLAVTLDLDAIIDAHQEAKRLDSTRPGLCTACAQNWPCDAVRLIDAHLIAEARFAVLEPGATVICRFNPGRLRNHEHAARLRQLLTARRPDVTWLVIEADEIVGFNPQPETRTTEPKEQTDVARCQKGHDQDHRQEGDRQEGDGQKGHDREAE